MIGQGENPASGKPGRLARPRPRYCRSRSRARPCARRWLTFPALKGRRKLTPETLGDYLRETQSRWFRLLDFEARFKVNKKTAWGYLNLLLQEGVLTHNGEKANRVRYALAAPFMANPASASGS